MKEGEEGAGGTGRNKQETNKRRRGGKEKRDPDERPERTTEREEDWTR